MPWCPKRNTIKKLHKNDKLLNVVYSHLCDYELREESKRKQQSIGKNGAVMEYMVKMTQSRKRKFSAETLLKREQKAAELTYTKLERRSLGWKCHPRASRLIVVVVRLGWLLCEYDRDNSLGTVAPTAGTVRNSESTVM